MKPAVKVDPVSTGGRHEEGRLALGLERGCVIEYVGGPLPYIWIGTIDGRLIDGINVDDLTAFLEAGAESDS